MFSKQGVSLISLFMIVALLLMGCAPAAAAQNQDPPALPTQAASPTSDPTAAPGGLRQVLVTDLDLGNDFQLNVGDALVVTLEGNPSTGYTWSLPAVKTGSPDSSSTALASASTAQV